MGILGQATAARPATQAPALREGVRRQHTEQRLAKLGWTQERIAEKLGVDERTLRRDGQNSHLGTMSEELGPHWNDKGIVTPPKPNIIVALWRKITRRRAA